MRTSSEYDAFGPWIDEVRTVDDIPRLYRNAGIDPVAYCLVLKVPRNIARRDATPEMHLYDHLLAVDQQALTVLSRADDTYHTLRLPLDHIVAIEDSVALLDGLLTLHTAGGWPVLIPYNGAAGTAIRDLVRLIRSRYLSPSSEAGPIGYGPIPGQDAPGLDAKDAGLVSALHKVIQDEPEVRLVSVTNRRAVTPTSGVLTHLRHMVWPVILQASITVTDGREIQVFHRRHWFSHRNDSVYSVARSILPLARVGAVHVRPHNIYDRTHLVAVHAGASCLWFPAPADPYVDALLAPFAAVSPR